MRRESWEWKSEKVDETKPTQHTATHRRVSSAALSPRTHSETHPWAAAAGIQLSEVWE